MLKHLARAMSARCVPTKYTLGTRSPGSRHGQFREKLAMERPMSLFCEREIAAASNDIMLERENWIEALVDYGHAINVPGIEATAYRSLHTLDGTLFWLVRRSGKMDGYHAEAFDPRDAIEEASTAWKLRKRVRRNWSDVERLSRDLILGRKRITVRIDDAYASPLCTMGVNAFMRRFGLMHVRVLSGWLAAILMRIDSQVGFVIHQAHLRELREAECSGSATLVVAEKIPRMFNPNQFHAKETDHGEIRNRT